MTQPQRSYLQARFTEPDEFVAELLADRDHVERRLVRLTKSGRPALDGVVTRIEILGGAIVDGRPVILRRYIGDLWQHPTEDLKVQERAEEVRSRLSIDLTAAGFDVRGGILEANDGTL